MTLSILLTEPWDARDPDTVPRLVVPKVRPHRFSWKNAGTVGIPKDAWHVVPQRWTGDDSGGSTDDAEVITSAEDEANFAHLHGIVAKNVDYLELRTDDVVASELIEVLEEMATQHPDAMWFVQSWTVESRDAGD